MLAVVLVPLLLLVVACLMERLEARVTPTASARRPRRMTPAPTPTAAASPAPTGDDAGPHRRHLAALPTLRPDVTDGSPLTQAG